MIAHAGIAKKDLARQLRVPGQTVGRISSGEGTTIPIDLMARLAEWAFVNGFSIAWLILGAGPMLKGDLPPESRQGQHVNQVLAYSMLLALAEEAGLDVGEIIPKWFVEMDMPGGGVATMELAAFVDKIKDQRRTRREEAPPVSPKKLVAGFHTVGPEDVPTAHDWHRHYVPILGEIAAGEGVETIQASEYPPSWAGEFLVYEGAPPTAVAVRVLGRSMEPLYHSGDVVVVDPAQPCESGEICCILLDRGDGRRVARLKRLRRRGGKAIAESVAERLAEVIPADQIVAAYRIIEHLPRVKEA